MSQKNVDIIATEINSKTDLWQKLIDDIKNPNLEIEQKRKKALSLLLAEWESEDLEGKERASNAIAFRARLRLIARYQLNLIIF